MLMQKGRSSIFGFRFAVFHSPSDGLLRRKSTVSTPAVIAGVGVLPNDDAAVVAGVARNQVFGLNTRKM